MKKFKDRFIRMFIMGLRQMQDPYYQGFAAQISFYLLLSIVPIFILISQVLGLFNISMETAVQVLEEYTGKQVSKMMSSLFRFSSLGFGNVIFLVIAFWAGSRASFALTRIANYTLTEGGSTGRNFFIERIRAIKTLLITIVTIVLSIVILCYGKLILSAIVSLLGKDPALYVDSIWLWMRWPLGFLLFFGMISYNYYILPSVKKPFRHVIPGSLFASAGLLVVTAVYSYYTSSLARYDIVYGALSSVVALLMWFFFLSWVLCLGVLCNKVWEDTSVPFSKSMPPEHLRMYHPHSKFDTDPDEFDLNTIKDIIIGEADTSGAGQEDAAADAAAEETAAADPEKAAADDPDDAAAAGPGNETAPAEPEPDPEAAPAEPDPDPETASPEPETISEGPSSETAPQTENT